MPMLKSLLATCSRRSVALSRSRSHSYGRISRYQFWGGAIIAALIVSMNWVLPGQRAVPVGSSILPVSSDPDETLVREFDIIAFNMEHGPGFSGPRAKPALSRWEDQIKILLEGPRVHEIAPLVRTQAQFLQEITGLKIIVVQNKADANMYITYLYKNELRANRNLTDLGELQVMEVLAGHGTCWTAATRKENIYIHASLVLIADSDTSIRTCIIEEMSQAMGLTHDSDELRDTLFSDRSEREDLSPNDVLLLRLLYHPRLKPGMSREKTLEIVRDIVRRRAYSRM
jgi:hypothetical protein